MASDRGSDSLGDPTHLRAVATNCVREHGPEVLGFLITLVRDEDFANEVFAQTCEDLWVGLPRFEGRASLRTWFYTLARNAAVRLGRKRYRHARRHAFSEEILDLMEQVRTRTQPFLRTDVKDRFAQIREGLAEEDRALLVLRVDRGMDWKDIARIVGPELASELDESRACARLRKRFQLLKGEIRSLARTAGLFEEEL